MVRLRFTIEEFGGGVLGFVDGLNAVRLNDEGVETLARVIGATATLSEFAKRVGISLFDLEELARSAPLLRVALDGDEPRYLKRNLREFWADQKSGFRWKPKTLF